MKEANDDSSNKGGTATRLLVQVLMYYCTRSYYCKKELLCLPRAHNWPRSSDRQTLTQHNGVTFRAVSVFTIWGDFVSRGRFIQSKHQTWSTQSFIWHGFLNISHKKRDLFCEHSNDLHPATGCSLAESNFDWLECFHSTSLQWPHFISLERQQIWIPRLHSKKHSLSLLWMCCALWQPDVLFVRKHQKFFRMEWRLPDDTSWKSKKSCEIHQQLATVPDIDFFLLLSLRMFNDGLATFCLMMQLQLICWMPGQLLCILVDITHG